MKNGKTVPPKDYKPGIQVYDYCEEKWGIRGLADQFIVEFREHIAIKAPKYVDVDMAYRRWIRRNGPSGDLFRPRYWEIKCEAAKRSDWTHSRRATSSPSRVSFDPWARRQTETAEAYRERVGRMMRNGSRG